MTGAGIDLSKLQELKTLIQTEEKFSDVWEFFFDHFGDHWEFLDVGKPVKSVLLTNLCEIVAERVYGPSSAVTHETWVYLEPQKFLHGSALLGGRMALAIYGTDIEMGMLSFQTTRGSQLMRFTSHGVKKRELNFPSNVSRAVH